MSFISVEFKRLPKALQYSVHILDTTFKEVLLAPRGGLTVGSGYGMVLNFYKEKKMPLASNFALMVRSFYKATAIGQINFMYDQINLYSPNLITTQILYCARRFLEEQ